MSKWLTAVTTLLALHLSLAAGAVSISKLEISPEDLESQQRQFRGPHIVAWDKDSKSDFLLLTIGGTNSRPSDMNEISKLALGLGFQTIGLDYNNAVISTTCKHSPDPRCFDLFRQTVVEGKEGPEFLHVDLANSLESRLPSVLRYMTKMDYTRWSRFYDLNSDRVFWHRIVVVGHSQGSGHAAYLAKIRPLKSVILLAGPQDRFESGLNQVRWIFKESKTKKEAYLGLLHEKDFFNAKFQLEAINVLRHEPPDAAPSFVELEAPVMPGKSVLVSHANVRDGHMAVIQKNFSRLWEYLLKEALKR